MQWPRVARTSDPTVICGHRLSFVPFCFFDTNPQLDGWLRCTKQIASGVFVSAAQSHSCEYDIVVCYSMYSMYDII